MSQKHCRVLGLLLSILGVAVIARWLGIPADVIGAGATLAIALADKKQPRLRRKKVSRTIHYLTIPEAATKLGLSYKQMLRVFERNFAEAAVQIGQHRGIAEEDLPGLAEAAQKAGYLKP